MGKSDSLMSKTLGFITTKFTLGEFIFLLVSTLVASFGVWLIIKFIFR